MSENYVNLTFSRDRESDNDVIQSMPWRESANALSIQLLNEFPEFEGRLHTLEVSDGVGEYTIKARIDLPGGELPDPSSILLSTVESLQAVYDKALAAGSFEIDKVVINGQEFLASDLTASVGPGI